MTEAEWLTEPDFLRHVEFVETGLSDRQRRLLAAAFCRLVLHLNTDTSLLRALEIAEEYADGNAKVQDLQDARQDCRETAIRAGDRFNRLAGDELSSEGTHWSRLSDLAWAVANTASTPLNVEDIGQRALGVAIQAGAGSPAAVGLLGVVPRPTESADASAARGFREMVVDIAGNPFATVEFHPEWQTSTVMALARGMYVARDFSAMPILADALQDAGCDDEAVLGHCRGDHRHVRGCWVVDAVLGLK